MKKSSRYGRKICSALVYILNVRKELLKHYLITLNRQAFVEAKEQDAEL